MRNKNILSLKYFVPFVFLVTCAVLFVKLFFIDLHYLKENEIQTAKNKLALEASRHQLNFSYLLKNQDFKEMEKVIAMYLLDNTHFDFFAILNNEGNIVIPSFYNYESETLADIQKEFDEHSLKHVFIKQNIFIQYDTHTKNRHFDVAIPLMNESLEENLRENSKYILYFHYNINNELRTLEQYFLKEFFMTFLMLLFLLIVIMIVNNKMVIKKLNRLIVVSQEYAENNFSQRLKVKGFQEIQNFSIAINNMADKVQSYQSLIKSQNIALRSATDEMTKFHRIVAQSPLIVIITKIDGTIEYVNPSFENTMGYSLEEINDTTPRVLRSGEHDPKFYADMWDTLKKGKTWEGRLINKTKDNNLITLDAQIFPIYDDFTNITHYISIQHDITQLTEQRRMISFQSKQAQMGEMLSMIAHQWRQPLASISSIIAALKVKEELGTLQIDTISGTFDKISDTIEYLSKTISDFSDFYKPQKEAQLTTFTKIVQISEDIIEGVMKSKGIVIEKRIAPVEFKSYENELVQVVLNLLKNTLDIYTTKKEMQNKKILITSESDEESVTLIFRDFAGGCEVDPIENIFIPYFTTKAELQGTGLGLYMSKTIVEEHCGGLLSAQNVDNGLEFRIKLFL